MLETSYDNKYGSGDRRDNIIVQGSDEAAKARGEIWIDGTSADGATGEGGYAFQFQALLEIDEITFEAFNSVNADLLRISYYNGSLKLLNNENEIEIESVEIENVRFVVFKFKERIRTNTINLQITNSSGSLISINFKNIELPRNILIRKDEEYGYYTDSFQSLGTSYPTEEQFKEYGMNNLSMLEAGDVPVEYEMELINETEEEKCFSYSFDLNGQHKNLKSIDSASFE